MIEQKRKQPNTGRKRKGKLQKMYYGRRKRYNKISVLMRKENK